MNKLSKTKFIFVTGGVYSSLGKGITASSIGRILKELGYKVAMQKLDPYLNVNPENISPLQHGEVYITADGLQADLDLGNYERFTDVDLNRYSSMTSGRIYSEVLAKENQGAYGGKTIQVIPHITNHIIENFHNLAKTIGADFIIVEIGGTVGDIESMPFFETIGIFAYEYGKENVIFAHCVPLIALSNVGEIKTKPAQHSLRTLRSLGISPDLVLLRTTSEIEHDTIDKLSRFSNINKDAFFIAPNLDSIYFLPEVLFQQGITHKIFQLFGIKDEQQNNLENWNHFVETIKQKKTKTINVGIIGEYVDLHDAYFSMIEAAKLSSYALNFQINFHWLHPEEISQISNLDCFIFGGGESETNNPEYAEFFTAARRNDWIVLSYFKGFENFAKIYHLQLEKMNSYGEKTSMINDPQLKAIYNSDLLCERHQHKTAVRKFADHEFLEVAAERDGFADVLKVKNTAFQYIVNFNPEFKARPLKPNPLINQFFKTVLERK